MEKNAEKRTNLKGVELHESSVHGYVSWGYNFDLLDWPKAHVEKLCCSIEELELQRCHSTHCCRGTEEMKHSPAILSTISGVGYSLPNDRDMLLYGKEQMKGPQSQQDCFFLYLFALLNSIHYSTILYMASVHIWVSAWFQPAILDILTDFTQTSLKDFIQISHARLQI